MPIGNNVYHKTSMARALESSVFVRSQTMWRTPYFAVERTSGSTESAETLPWKSRPATVLVHHQGQKGAPRGDEDTSNHPGKVGQATGRKVNRRAYGRTF